MIIGTKTCLRFRVKYVQIFKLIILFPLIVFSYDGELIRLSIDNNQNINKVLSDKLSEDINPTAYFKLEDIDQKKRYVEYKKYYLKKSLDTLIISSTQPLSKNFLNNFKSTLIDLPIGKKFERESNKFNQRYEFLDRPPHISFGKIDKNTFGGLVFIDPQFENYFSGVLGLGRNNDRLSFNGEINIHVENIIERAGSYELFWKKIDSLSQKISMKITQPHLPFLNLGIYWNFEHELFPKFYSLNTNEIRAQYYHSYFNNLGVGYTYSVTMPTDKGLLLGYQEVNSKSITLTLNNKTIDNRVLPREGFQYELKVNSGIQNNSNFIESRFDIESYYPVYNQYNLKLSSKSRMIWSNASIPKSRYVFFGGLSNLRGYNENQFSSIDYQIISIDFGINRFNNFRSSIFVDQAFTFKNNSNFRKTSLGIGVVQINDKSIIEIQYGMPINESVSNGKVHIKFISKF